MSTPANRLRSPDAAPSTADAAPSAADATPVTADDVDRAVRLSVAALRAAPPSAPWDDRAGTLDWSCWETVEHLADDLFAYALQLGPREPPLTTHVPAAWQRRRTPGGPANTIFVERNEGPDGLLQVLEGCGALLVAMVRTTPSRVRAHHVFGVSDPEGFGAMGVVETLVHTRDVALGLAVPFEPPGDLCGRVLTRLFPGAPADGDPWTTLLWATGRTELPGRPRQETWRWYGEPRP